ncbi:hypothetical protein L5G32_00465 [Gordonia sp. HY002]|uniref:hypothetical protein n=1 Tax=Gordonia zhenghanii TaxID=2911516 RepID=UPI001EF0DE46|nr:hypothetical protein [Gordonia zhenghanii]MCF8568739.1 hypothetical protein [Gordonia zhenghanii]MCF8607044.1 hypothetical protein [Gordonia zhenghanii]
MTIDVGMPVMLGLRTRRLHVAVGILLLAYAAVRATAFVDPRTGLQWVLEALAAVGLAVVANRILAGGEDPLPYRSTAAVTVVGVAAVTAAWWAIPQTADDWVQVGAPLVVFAVVAGLLTLRGRSGAAWASCGVVLVSAVWWSVQHGGTAVAGGQLTIRMVMALLPATLMAWLVRPMIRLTGALEVRRVAAARSAAVTRATAVERAERLRVFGEDVRPYLQKVADGDEFDEESAIRAHLMEQGIRDSVRGAGWCSPETTASLAAARARGVAVRVLDDSSTAPSSDDAPVLHTELAATLAAASSGVVTARILPHGREDVAVLTVVTADGVIRLVAARRNGVLAWSTETSADGSVPVVQ